MNAVIVDVVELVGFVVEVVNAVIVDVVEVGSEFEL